MSSSKDTPAMNPPKEHHLSPWRVFDLLKQRYPEKKSSKPTTDSPFPPLPFPIPKTNPLPIAQTDAKPICLLTSVFDVKRRQCKLARDLQELKDEINENLALSDLNDRIKTGEKIEMQTQNSRRNLLTFIPRIGNSRSFKSWASRLDGLVGILNHLASGLHRTTREFKSALMIFAFLAENFPRSFELTAKTFGYQPPIQRLTAIETASLAKHVGLTDKQLFDKLGRHLTVLNCGHHILCSQAEFYSLTNDDTPSPRVFKGMLLKENKKEEYTVCKMNVLEQMTKGMARMLTRTVHRKPPKFNKFGSPMFDYPTSTNQSGVYYMDGADYGGGAIQFFGRLNYGSPKERRISGNAENGTMDFRFGVVKCPKERSEIISIFNKDVHKSVNILRQSQMVGILNSIGDVHCVLIDKRAVEIEILESQLFVKMPSWGKPSKLPLMIDLPDSFCSAGNLRWFSVIKHFQVLQIGDLCAQLLLQGRKGMSSCRCLKCIFTSRQWKEVVTSGKLLRRCDLKSSQNRTIGQTEHRYWPYNPSECVVPLLHCEIGTAQVQIFDHLIPYLLKLDKIPLEETTKMNELERKKETKNCKEQIHSDAVHEMMARKLLAVEEKKIVRLELNRARARLKTAKSSSLDNREQRIQMNSLTVDQLKDDLLCIDEDVARVVLKVEKAKRIMRDAEAEVDSIKKELTKMVKARAKVFGSLFSDLQDILKVYNIHIQAYHGGSLTGGDIIKFFGNGDEILDKLEQKCLVAIEKRVADRTANALPTAEEMRTYLNGHREMFALQHAVYGNLRIVNPTKRELQKTRVSIAAMKKLWLEMGFSETPKAHLIFWHTADDQKRWKGLGDKTEDALERIHQTQKRHDAITMRMRGGDERRLKRQAIMSWREGDPRVDERIAAVVDQTARTSTEDRDELTRKKRTAEKEVRNERYKKACIRTHFEWMHEA